MEKKPFNKFAAKKKLTKDGKFVKKTKTGTGKGLYRKKACKFCTEKVMDVDYKDIGLMQKFITERGKITPSRLSGLCATHQRKLAHAIKRARHISLLPYTAKY